MQYKKYDGNSYNIYTIKNDKFKSCIINVIFRNELEDFNTLAHLNILKSMMVQTNKTYKTRRDLVIKCEELYNANFYASSHRLGNSYELDFGTEFINPYYIKEKKYLDDIIEFNFDMILNPDVKNDEFNIKMFNVVKEKLILGSQSIIESGPKFSIKRAFQVMDPESVSSKYMEKEDYEKATPTSLYKTYKKLIQNSFCDIYVIGDMDMDEVAEKIKKYFNLKMIKNHNLNLYTDNKKRKKIKVVKETADYVQANLVMGYNVDELNEKEKIAIRFFLEIFGGGMNSKLYQNLRVKNSLCYGVRPIYYKYDRLIFVHVSFDEENYEKAVKLINDSMKDMKKGNISEEEFNRAKKSLQFSFKLSKDSINSIMDNYVFYNLREVPIMEDYEEKIADITIKDVIEVAKKITPNFVYLLGKEGDK